MTVRGKEISLRFSSSLLILLASLLANLSFIQPCFSENQDSVVSFHTIIPFAKDEYGFCVSVVSDSSVWYTTNKGLFHFNGNTSEKIMEASAFTASQIEILLVDAPSDDNVWVVGHDARSWKKTMYHFDGTQWHKVAFPQASSDPNDDLVVHKLKMVANGTVTTGCVVGQDGLVYLYNGKRWNILPRFTEQTLRALVFRSLDDIWVGGKNGTVFHFDGVKWQCSDGDSLSSENYFLDINFAGNNSGWATGVKGLMRFDGSRWNAVQLSPAVAAPLNDIDMISAEDGWAISRDGDVLRYTEGAWVQLKKLSTGLGFNSIAHVRHGAEYNLFLLTRKGLLKNYWGNIPTFSDFSAASNIHLYGGYASLADFDGNGTQDLYTSAIGLYPDRLYSNRGDGFFSEVTEHLHPVDAPTGFAPIVADIDNNGFPDLYFVKGVQQDAWYRNLGSWKFRGEHSPVPSSQVSDRDVARFADMDNDGDLDLVYLYAGDPQREPTMSVVFNDGIGNFTGSVNFGRPLANGGVAYAFFLADLNNDGLIDVFKYNLGDRCELYLNNGDHTFTETASASGVDGTYFNESPNISYACPIDINHDRAMDVFIVSRKGRATFFMNDGKGKFSAGESIMYDPKGENPDMRFVDIDNDGDQDLLLLGQFYENREGKFSPYNNIGFTKFGSSELFDIDGDGDRDIFMQSLEEKNRIFIYKNEYNPSNSLALSLKGIENNSFGIGATVTLWQYTGDDRKVCADFVQVESTLPVCFSLVNSSRYDIDVRFPGGRKVHREHIVPGKLEIAEFSFPVAEIMDMYSSFRRSLLYADFKVEMYKFGLLVLFLFMLTIVPFTKNVRSFLIHPLFLGVLLILYVIIIHATIREGILFSGIVSFSSIVFLSAMSVVVAKVTVARREANYIS